MPSQSALVSNRLTWRTFKAMLHASVAHGRRAASSTAVTAGVAGSMHKQARSAPRMIRAEGWRGKLGRLLRPAPAQQDFQLDMAEREHHDGPLLDASQLGCHSACI
ncbi:hypothetical protein J1614_011872 [Plenodomus biglobosus]|nr:hypothetical protein J1614_011872 [Plenodomus biglobosus]